MADNNDNYNLYTEKIKLRPSVKYKTLILLAKIVFFAAVAGVVAGMFFVAVINLSGIADEDDTEQRHEITIPVDEYPTTDKKDSGAVEEVIPVVNEVAEAGNIYDYVAQLVQQINPALVTVTAISAEQDPLFEMFLKETNRPGIIIADNGFEYLILTDYDIVDMDFIEVTFVDEMHVNASLVMADKTMDMAIIAVTHDEMEFETQSKVAMIEMGNSYLLTPGELIVAMGNMYGIQGAIDFGTAVSTKEYSYDSDSKHKLVYTSMNGTNESSGFIFNDKGQLIGSICKKESENTLVAYGISDIKMRIQNLTNRKPISYLGIVGQEVTEEMSETMSIPVGVYVTSTEYNSPAYFTGIQSGDIVTGINGRTIANVYNMEHTMCELQPGTEVVVVVYRKGKDGYVPIEFTTTLSSK